MLTRLPRLSSLVHAQDCCNDLLCLLRLSEIVIADPGREAALRAMVDELVQLERVNRSAVALPEANGAKVRYLAHRGLPGHVAHRPFTDPVDTVVAEAMTHRRIVERPGEDGGDARGGCVALPILAEDEPVGVLGLRLKRGLPLDAWQRELFSAAADLMALVVLGGRTVPVGAEAHTGELRLTRRQRDVLFELVERGAGNERIGHALGLSARTVKIHLQAAYRQLGVRSRAEAIRLILTKHADWLERERERRQGGGHDA